MNRKKAVKTIGFILLATILSLNGFAQQITSHTKPFFFFQMTDTQFGMFKDNNGFEKEHEILRKLSLVQIIIRFNMATYME